MNTVLRYLRQAALNAGVSDAQLLDAFSARKEEGAFTALVKRHGPMVMGVCLRVLRHREDAEDAFQATFLVLVRKASSLRSRELLGNWLYGVAYRTAMKAKTMNAKRRARETQASVGRRTAAGEARDDLLPVLDQELTRLPDKYRAPIVLCDLEGKTRVEAARLLGCPIGTVSWRLAEGRKMLAAKLSKYAPVSAGAMAGLLAQQAPACLPVSLVAATTKAAILSSAGPVMAAAISGKVLALSEGVVKMSLLAKLKVMSAICVGVVAAGVTGGFAYFGADATHAGQLEQWSAEAPQLSPNLDTMFPDGKELDFGKVRHGAIVERVFPIVNTGSTPLRFVYARVSCGCMKASLDKTMLQPGEKAMLHVVVDTQRFIGIKRMTILVGTEHDAFRLTVTVNSEPDGQATPPAVRDRQHLPEPQRAAPAVTRPTRLSSRTPTSKEDFEEQRTLLMNQFAKRRDQLEKQHEEQLRQLVKENRQALKELSERWMAYRETEELKTPLAPAPSPVKDANTSDKLDQILKRLERMEGRLERLEKGPSAPAPVPTRKE